MRLHRIAGFSTLAAVLLGTWLLSLPGSQGLVTAQGTSSAAASFEVVRIYPHDTSAFTQGLIYRDGFLYESTGLNGRSTVRKVDLLTGRVIQQHRLEERYFGEGLTAWGSTLVQLTWQANLGFVYDMATLRQLRTFNYSGEGWGLTHNGTHLILSDGSSELRFLHPETFQEVRRISVRDGVRLVNNLNELEFVHGDIYANVWQTDRIARIAPDTGQVRGWIDLSGLRPAPQRSNPDAVLNGIAHDTAQDRLFVTGKLWPSIFEIKVVEK